MEGDVGAGPGIRGRGEVVCVGLPGHLQWGEGGEGGSSPLPRNQHPPHKLHSTSSTSSTCCSPPPRPARRGDGIGSPMVIRMSDERSSVLVSPVTCIGGGRGEGGGEGGSRRRRRLFALFLS